MIIVMTNRKLADVAADQAETINVADMGVELGERAGEQDIVRTGLLSDDGQRISFCARGDESGVFSKAGEKDSGNPWVVFVHGFHQDPDENIAKAIALQNNHGVNVIVFAWPSRPHDESMGWDETYKSILRNALLGMSGAAIAQALASARVKSFLKDMWKNYPSAISNAEQSPVDLIAALTLVKKYLLSDQKPMLLVHSMGNYVLESTIKAFGQLPMKFSHIMLHQADVNSQHHQWVNSLQGNLDDGAKLYITINAPDYVLAASSTRRMLLRQAATERLGQLRKTHFITGNVHYLDFTNGPKSDNKHEFFRYKRNRINPHVFDCLHRIFRGEADELPIDAGASQSGFSKMPTAITLYWLQEIIDPVEGEWGVYENDVLVQSLDWFVDPLDAEDEPIDVSELYDN